MNFQRRLYQSSGGTERTRPCERHLEGGQIRKSKEERARDACSGPRGVVQCPRLSPVHRLITQTTSVPASFLKIQVAD